MWSHTCAQTGVYVQKRSCPTPCKWCYTSTIYGSTAVSSLQSPGVQGMSLLETSSSQQHPESNYRCAGALSACIFSHCTE